MGKRIVEITQTALGDMEGIYDYIADVLLASENAQNGNGQLSCLLHCRSGQSDSHRCLIYGASNVHARLKTRHMTGPDA